MTDWLRDEIEAARKRREAGNRKLARRELDAEVIATHKRHFWSQLSGLLRVKAGEINNELSLNPGIDFAEKGDSIWVRTQSVPATQAYLEFRDRMNDILFHLSDQQYTHTPMTSVLETRFSFDVDENGACMVGVDNTLMDVDRLSAYFMRPIIQSIHSGT